MLLRHCCFCIELRSGALILGWLQIIVSSAFIIRDMLRWLNEDAAEALQDLDGVQVSASAHFELTLMSIVLESLTLSSGALLVVGVYKRNRGFLMQWVIGTAVLTALGLVWQVFLFAVVAVSSEMRIALTCALIVVSAIGVCK